MKIIVQNIRDDIDSELLKLRRENRTPVKILLTKSEFSDLERDFPDLSDHKGVKKVTYMGIPVEVSDD